MTGIKGTKFKALQAQPVFWPNKFEKELPAKGQSIQDFEVTKGQ